jgi:PAS domain S-box-containing protein
MDLPRMTEYHQLRRQGDVEVPSQYEFHVADKTGNLIYACANIHMIPGTRRSVASVVNITPLKETEDRQEMLIKGLHTVVSVADELIACRDVDSLYRRAVELAREELGVERCAVFLLDGREVRGTYGTDMRRRTTDEHGNIFIKSEEWDQWFEERVRQDTLWTVAEMPCTYWNGSGLETGDVGWVAHTPIAQEANKPFAVFVNDCAISHRPVDAVLQEVIAVYCSLLANIIIRKKAEEELRGSREKMQTIFASMKDVIMVLNEEGRYLEIAPTDLSLLYRPLNEIVGKTLHEVFDQERADYFLGLVREALQARRAITTEYQLEIGGKNVWFNATISPMTDNKVLLVARDVTDRVRREERERIMHTRLSRAQRMESLGLMAGGVAHDLNNLLGPIVAYPDLILMQLPEDSPVRNDILTMQTAAKRSAAIIQDLLTLSRRGASMMEPVSLNSVVRDYLDSASFIELQERFPEVHLDTRLTPHPRTIMGSPHHLGQALMNLVINAYEVIPEGGTAVIETCCERIRSKREGFEPIPAGEFCTLSVSDTGPGIDPKDAEHIFEPFFTRKKMGRSGTGLGLAVVYGVVKDMHGYIDVKAVPGQGTTFILYFPLVQAKKTADQTPAVSGNYSGSEEILVIDDESSQRELARRILENLGYRVFTAAGRNEALAFLRRQSVDLIVLDMILGEHYDGLDVYRLINDMLPGQKCVIVSGFSESDRVRDAQKLGVGAFLAKPYTKDDLGRVVREELEH